MQMHHKMNSILSRNTMWSDLDTRLDNNSQGQHRLISLLLWRSQWKTNAPALVLFQHLVPPTVPPLPCPRDAKTVCWQSPCAPWLKATTPFLPHLKQDTWHRHTSFAKTEERTVCLFTMEKENDTGEIWDFYIYLWYIYSCPSNVKC